MTLPGPARQDGRPTASHSLTLPDGSSRDIACGQCGTTTFVEEIAKAESRFGFTQHKILMLVCTHCSHLEEFYDTRVIFAQTS